MSALLRKRRASNSINLFDILPNTIWYDIYKQKSIYNNLEELYKLNTETRNALLDMIKFRRLKLFHGIVYASGYGRGGQLGDGRTDDHSQGTPIPIDISDIDYKRVIQVSAGFFHSLFLCENGSVYASGWGNYGRLGDGRTYERDEGTPIPIDTDIIGEKRVIQVSAGKFHSLFLCEDGSVYASGNGIFGVLGDGRIEIHYEGTPIPIDMANMQVKRVIQVSAGVGHSLFLCKDGSVYASGRGRYGVLGDGITDRHEVGIPIPINTSNMNGKRVIQVSAGKEHSLFLCENGTVYASGWGQYGVLGNGRTDRHHEGTPIPIDTANMDGKRVIQVAAGDYHSLFLCEDGSVYASGDGGDGQLGDGRTGRHSEGTPIPIDTANMEGKRVIQVSAVRVKSLFLCEDGSVYACGKGKNGQLGDGRTDDHSEGTPIPINMVNMNGKRVIQVSAGGFHSLFLT